MRRRVKRRCPKGEFVKQKMAKSPRSNWLFALLLCSGVAMGQSTPWIVPSATEVDALYKQAQEATAKGEWERAAGLLKQYHEMSRAPGPHGGVRLSYALAYWRLVGEKHPPALGELRDARDRAASKVRAGGYGSRSAMSELASLNGCLSDPRATADTFAWLLERRPADARTFTPLALPALVAADRAAMALPFIDTDQLLRDAKRSLETDLNPRYGLPQWTEQDRIRFAQESMDRRAAPTVAALVKGGALERAQALAASVSALLGPDAALPATAAALKGQAPKFGDLGDLPAPTLEPVWMPPAQPDLDAMDQQARADVEAGRYAQAAAYHRWYFANVLGIAPSYSGVRRSFALSHWRALGELYPAALQDMREARDGAMAQVRAGGPEQRQAVRDLVALEEHLADPSGSAATALWLQVHRPADLPAFVSEALPALVAASNASLVMQHFDAPPALAAIQRTFKSLSERSRSDRSADELRRSAQAFADGQAAPVVAAMVQTAQVERARAFVAQVRALIGADAKLPECEDALRGFAPRFGRG